MGNKASSASGIDSALSTFTSRGEDTENTYSRQSVSLSHRISPPFPKRHFTVVEKPNSSGSEAQLLQRANSASSLRPMGGVIQSSDDIGKHIVSTIPNDGARDVSLGTSIIIFLDKDIRTVNTNNIIKVTCDSSDSTSNPTTVQGQINYDPKQMKVEFIPKKTLFPNSKITVSLSGKAITSISCNTGANIVDTSFSFYTDTPPPKTVRIKLKEQPNVRERIIINITWFKLGGTAADSKLLRPV
jgi:hypothetical protein